MYDIAISFAGEDRKIAEKIASSLKENWRVFYDEYEQASLWGKDLYAHLSSVYSEESRFCLMLISEHYVNKQWTNLERRAAQARAFRENQEYILPLRLDNASVDGVLDTVGYIDYRNVDLEHIINLINTKLEGSTNKGNESHLSLATDIVIDRPHVIDFINSLSELMVQGEWESVLSYFNAGRMAEYYSLFKDVRLGEVKHYGKPLLIRKICENETVLVKTIEALLVDYDPYFPEQNPVKSISNSEAEINSIEKLSVIHEIKIVRVESDSDGYDFVVYGRLLLHSGSSLPTIFFINVINGQLTFVYPVG